MEVASLKEGEWSCYRGGQFKGSRIIVTEVAGLMVVTEVVSLI